MALATPDASLPLVKSSHGSYTMTENICLSLILSRTRNIQNLNETIGTLQRERICEFYRRVSILLLLYTQISRRAHEVSILFFSRAVIILHNIQSPRRRQTTGIFRSSVSRRAYHLYVKRYILFLFL